MFKKIGFSFSAKDNVIAKIGILSVFSFFVIFANFPTAFAENIRINLIIEEPSLLNRTNEPTSTGIPLAMGAANSTNSMRILDESGRPVPAQFRITARYPDNSIRFILVDFQPSVNSGSQANYSFVIDQSISPAQPAQKITLTDNSDNYAIDTGAATFVIAKTGDKLFREIRMGGKNILSSEAHQGFALTDQFGKKFISDPDDASITILESGELKTVLKISGKNRAADSTQALSYSLYLHFFAGKADIKGYYRIENRNVSSHPGNFWDLGSSGNFLFEDLRLELKLDQAPQGFMMIGDLEEPAIKDEFPASGVNTISLYQDSSGGVNWQSRNHVNRNNEVKNSFKGYKIYANNQEVADGDRALGYGALTGDNLSLSGGIRDFWQNFPSGLELDRQGKFDLVFFPKNYNDLHELQGGEFKTHEFFLSFQNSRSSTDAIFDQAIAVNEPLLARVDQNSYLASGAFYDQGLFQSGKNSKYEETLQAAVIPAGNNQRTLLSQRETIDEYGWRNFGEVMADHETNCGVQSYDVPISHYNNQYDGFFGAFIQYARQGNREFYKLAEDGIRHLADIDIYHVAADSDNGLYEGGLFPHTTHDSNAETSTHRSWSKKHQSQNCTQYNQGGGLDPWHHYTDGIWTYCQLSGYQPACEAAVETSDYMARRIQKGSGFDDARARANGIRSMLAAYKYTLQQNYLDQAGVIVEKTWQNRQNFSGTSWEEAMLAKSLGQYLDLLAKEKNDESSSNYQKARETLLTLAEKITSNYNYSGDIQGLRFSDALLYAYKYDPKTSYRDQAAKIFEDFQNRYWAAGTYSNAKEMSIALTNGHMYLALMQPVSQVLQSGNNSGNQTGQNSNNSQNSGSTQNSGSNQTNSGNTQNSGNQQNSSNNTQNSNNNQNQSNTSQTNSTPTANSCAEYNRLFDSQTHWGREYIKKLVCMGMMTGYETHAFRPNAAINRAEAAKVIALAHDPASANYPPQVFFADMKDWFAWYMPYVTYLKERGIVDGRPDGNFYPADALNRAEAVKLVLSLFPQKNQIEIDGFDDVKVSAWYFYDVTFAKQIGLVEGYAGNEFRPGNPISRAEFAAILSRALELKIVSLDKQANTAI